MKDTITPPLKWHGGKQYLASRIVELMPPHTHYVEPYMGGAAVMLAKDPEGVSEVVNDVDGRLMNFWRCLQCPRSFAEFSRMSQCIPFCESAWKAAVKRLETPCEAPAFICLNCGLAFFVACRQSLAGRMDTFAPISRNRTRRGMNEQVSAWLGAVDGLAEVHSRLRRVLILDAQPALKVIRSNDGPQTLFYLDPPYLPATRTAPKVYAHELTRDDHVDLLAQIQTCVGKVMLSGYRNELYDGALRGWKRHDFDLPNHSAGGKSKRRMVESVWCNFGA